VLSAIPSTWRDPTNPTTVRVERNTNPAGPMWRVLAGNADIPILIGMRSSSTRIACVGCCRPPSFTSRSTPPSATPAAATTCCGCGCDDGRGGADLAGGSGLVGLKDRVEALGGRLWVRSPLDAGTTVRAELPLSPTRPIAGWPRAETVAIPDVS
jgi:hypothetical protein